MKIRITRRLKSQLDRYADFHRNPMNELIHDLFIPVITLAMLGLFAQISLTAFDGGYALWAVVMTWYFTMDWKITIPFSAVSFLIYQVSLAIPTPLLWVLFIGGWGIQTWGHVRFEGNRPAILQNLLQAGIAPLYLFSKWVGYYAPRR